MKILEQYCNKIGRDPAGIEKSLYSMLGVYRDKQEMMERMRNDYESMSRGTDITFEKWLEMSRSRYILETPDTWLDKIREITDLGITHFVIGSERRVTDKRIDDLRLFSDKVISKI